MRYRRANAAGAAYFFTLNLAWRSHRSLCEHIAELRDAVRTVKARHPFAIDAWVVLPDHMHAIWTLPAGDRDFATRWMLIKSNFSRRIPKGETISLSRARKGERGLWQRRYWEHQIRDKADFAAHVNYVHINPVKHGYVANARDWPFSSIHRYIHAGDFATDWGSSRAGNTESQQGQD